MANPKALNQFKNLKRQKLIDKILDKISSQGIESLDRYERETLDNENNPNFDEKSSLISKIKYIVDHDIKNSTIINNLNEIHNENERSNKRIIFSRNVIIKAGKNNSLHEDNNNNIYQNDKLKHLQVFQYSFHNLDEPPYRLVY